MKKILSTALVCALLAGCGGGGGGSTPPVNAGPQSGGTAKATLNFKFNTQSSIGGQARGRKYISRNTLGLGISYRATGAGALGAAPVPVLSTVAGASTTGAIDVAITYVNQFGQSASSPGAISTPTAAQQVQVAAPGPSGNATGYNVYARLSGVGAYYLQNTSPIGVTSTYTIPGTLVSSGAVAPAIDTTAGAFGATEGALRAPNWATAIHPGMNSNLTTCTAADTTPGPTLGSFSCSVVISVPAGYNDFQITTWDAAPLSLGTGGTFGAGANDLSTATIANQYIQVNQNNVFNYALNGVVNSVVLALTTQSLVAGATLGQLSNGTPINPASVTLAVLAKDYDGNIIIGGDPYVDVNGTPVTVNLSKVETPPATVIGNVAPSSGNVTFNTAAVTGTGNACIGGATQTCTFVRPGSVALAYNGYDTQSEAFNANVTGGVAIPGLGSAITFTRTLNGGLGVPAPLVISEFASPTLGALNGNGGSLGPDGNVWFAHSSGDLVVVPPGGAGIHAYSTAGIGATNTSSTSSGPDGKIWFTDNNAGLGRINTDGTGLMNESAGLAHFTSPSYMTVTLGGDDRLWVAENQTGYVEVVNPDGTNYASYNVGGWPVAIAYGSNGHYFIANNLLGLQEFDPVSQSVVRTYSAIDGGTVVALSDGKIYGSNTPFGQSTATIYQVTPGNASPATYTVASDPGKTLNNASLAGGTDGNLWIVFGGGTNQYNAVVRMTPSGAFTAFTSGITTDSFALAATFGADGNLYFAEGNSNKFGELHL